MLRAGEEKRSKASSVENGNVKKNREAEEAKRAAALEAAWKDIQARRESVLAAAATAGTDVSDVTPGATKAAPHLASTPVDAPSGATAGAAGEDTPAASSPGDACRTEMVNVFLWLYPLDNRTIK